MSVEDDIGVRLSAQRALLGNVVPMVRAVSVEADPERRAVRVRFVFDGAPSESVLDAASVACAEVIADYPDAWQIEEDYVNCPAPNRMEHLRFVVYARCEDEWVSPRA